MEITLMSMEEAKKLPNNIRKINKEWWLRSPSKYEWSGVYVDEDGEVFNDNGVCVDLGVRPMLLLDNDTLETLPKTDLGIVIYGSRPDGTMYEWIDISNYLEKPAILMKECMQEDKIFDENTNIYESASIKKYLEEFYNELTKTIDYKSLELQNYEWMDDAVIDYDYASYDIPMDTEMQKSMQWKAIKTYIKETEERR